MSEILQPNVPELMKKIPQLQSLLYDLNLMPEQWDGPHDQWRAEKVALHLQSITEESTFQLTAAKERITELSLQLECAGNNNAYLNKCIMESDEDYNRLAQALTKIEHAESLWIARNDATEALRLHNTRKNAK